MANQQSNDGETLGNRVRKNRAPDGRFLLGNRVAQEEGRPWSKVPKAPRMLFRHILENDQNREALVKALEGLIRQKGGRGALAFLAEASDRLEGKPVQTHQVAAKRTTIFQMACDHEPGTLPGGPAPLKGEVSDVEERPFTMGTEDGRPR